MAAETLARDLRVPRRGLTRIQYDALVQTGLLEGEPVELLEGILIDMVPQGPEHSQVIRRLTRWLSRALPEEWFVGVQSPLAAGGSSQPEPDLAIVRDTAAHPITAALVVEVAATSQRLDLIHKPRIYAAAGVGQYWVLDLPARDVVVHTEPLPDSGYATVTRLPWSTPLEVLGVRVDLDAILGDR